MSEHPLPSSIAPRGASANESHPEPNCSRQDRDGRAERAPSSHLVSVLAAELGIAPHRIGAAVALLDADNSVPFIARYRKEATGALTDTQLRAIQTRLGQLRALEERRARVLEAQPVCPGRRTDKSHDVIIGHRRKGLAQGESYHPFSLRHTLARVAVSYPFPLPSTAPCSTPARQPDRLRV